MAVIPRERVQIWVCLSLYGRCHDRLFYILALLKRGSANLVVALELAELS